jgi:hypothetical protein
VGAEGHNGWSGDALMKRMIVNVASTEHTRKGQARLEAAAMGYGVPCLGGTGVQFRPWGAIGWHGATEPDGHGWPIPAGWPTHQAKPYAFKAYALAELGQNKTVDSLLWCDACILPVRDMEPVWEKIERDGYLFMNNGFSNYEWTADSAYLDLFPEHADIALARMQNRGIKHTVGGFFGLSMRHEIGRSILAEFYRLAETNAFCGPWKNTPEAPCGPPDVRGHRHDQSALSVLAWRHGCKLTDPPEYFCYGKAQDAQDPRTVVVADGSY